MFNYTYLEDYKNELEKTTTYYIIEFVETQKGGGDIHDDISDFIHSRFETNDEQSLDEYYNEHIGKCELVAMAQFGDRTITDVIENIGLGSFIYHISATAKSDELIDEMEQDIDTLKRLFATNFLMRNNVALVKDSTLESAMEHLRDLEDFSDIENYLDKTILQRVGLWLSADKIKGCKNSDGLAHYDIVKTLLEHLATWKGESENFSLDLAQTRDLFENLLNGYFCTHKTTTLSLEDVYTINDFLWHDDLEQDIEALPQEIQIPFDELGTTDNDLIDDDIKEYLNTNYKHFPIDFDKTIYDECVVVYDIKWDTIRG